MRDARLLCICWDRSNAHHTLLNNRSDPAAFSFCNFTGFLAIFKVVTSTTSHERRTKKSPSQRTLTGVNITPVIAVVAVAIEGIAVGRDGI